MDLGSPPPHGPSFGRGTLNPRRTTRPGGAMRWFLVALVVLQQLIIIILILGRSNAPEIATNSSPHTHTTAVSEPKHPSGSDPPAESVAPGTLEAPLPPFVAVRETMLRPGDHAQPSLGGVSSVGVAVHENTHERGSGGGGGGSVVVGGVGVFTIYDSPGWMQRRYPMVVANALMNLPPDWKIQLIVKDSKGAKKGLAKLERLRERYGDRIVTTWIPESMSKLRRVQLIATPWFWGSLVADRVLVLGAGSALCGGSTVSIERFFDYDLVGALWTPRREDRPGDTRSAMFVNRGLMLRAIATKNVPEHGPPPGDGTWMHDALRQTVDRAKQAPRDVQELFAVASTGVGDDVTPFIVGGTMANIPGNRSRLVEECPEIKMIFPSLHEPTCFGAKSTLDRDACYASLCVTNPKPGGC